jgi:hypothetical protein
MDNSERPRLSIGIEAHIEEAQSQADTRLRDNLQKFLGPTPLRQERTRLQYPMRIYSPPAKKPKLLLSVFAFYARELHIAEGHHYQQDPRLEIWLRNLTERIIERAMGVVVNVEQFGDGHDLSLWYHGATIEEMRQAIVDTVEPLISGRITPTPDSPPPPPEAQRQMSAQVAAGLDVAARVDTPTPSQLRKAFVQPLLDEKSWSVAEWAEKAKVSRHTANDYLEAKRKTYHSSLKELAKALGVSFHELPK